jgi:hypothetical protein
VVNRLIDEDWQLRRSLAACDPAWVGELEFVLNSSETYRNDLRRLVAARPNLADLGELLAMADSNEVVRLRLLRAIRDIESH